jgi:hypothetical protein
MSAQRSALVQKWTNVSIISLAQREIQRLSLLKMADGDLRLYLVWI